MSKQFRVGVDFDNTIVCYDNVFHKVATTTGLIPQDTPNSKEQIRNYLRDVGQEDEWTTLQGYVYGQYMHKAEAFPGALDFFSSCLEADIAVFIISHRTKQPYLGPPHDLHESAFEWIKSNGLKLPSDNVFFETTLEAKLRRIADTNCSVFLDDLPEFLSESDFPTGTAPVLFDPGDTSESRTDFARVASWNDFLELVQFKSKQADT